MENNVIGTDQGPPYNIGHTPFTMIDSYGLEEALDIGPPSEHGDKDTTVYVDGDLKIFTDNNNKSSGLLSEPVLESAHFPGAEVKDVGNNVKVVIVTDSDATKLLEVHKRCTAFSNEILLFIENDDGYNVAGRTVLVKVGSKVPELYPNFKNLNLGRLNDKKFSIPQKQINELLSETVLESKRSILGWCFYAFSELVEDFVDLSEWAFDGIGDVLVKTIPTWIDNNIKFNKARWDSSLEDYNPVFEVQLIFKFLDKVKDEASERNIVAKVLNPFFKQIKASEATVVQQLKDVKFILPKYIYNKLKSAIKYVYSKVYDLKDYLLTNKNIIFDVIKTSIEAVNALMCGLFNSVIDVISGLLQLIGYICKGAAQVLKLSQDKLYYGRLVLESIENVVEAIFTVDWGQCFKNGIVSPIKKMVAWFNNGKSMFSGLDFSVVQVFYGVGYFLGILVETIVSVMFTGGSLTVANILKELATPITLIAKGAKFLVKGGAKIASNLLTRLVGALRKFFTLLKNPNELLKVIDGFIEGCFEYFKRVGAKAKAYTQYAANIGKLVKDAGGIYINKKVRVGTQWFYNQIKNKSPGNLRYIEKLFKNGNYKNMELAYVATKAEDGSVAREFLGEKSAIKQALDNFSDNRKQQRLKDGLDGKPDSLPKGDTPKEILNNALDDIDAKNKNLLKKAKKLKFVFKGFVANFDDHAKYLEINISINNPKVPKKIIVNGEKIVNPDFNIENYSYYIGRDEGKYTVEQLKAMKLQPQVKKIGGFHMGKVPDGIQVTDVVDPKFLSTGEKVRQVTVQGKAPEFQNLVNKTSISTLWPKEWSIEKIKKVIEEATENVTLVKGRKYQGVSKDGVPIEWYVDQNQKGLIETAYIKIDEL